VQEASKNAGPPIWDVVETYLKDKKTISPVKLYNPKLLCLDGNPGVVI
jgi:sulfur-oxidizing protein SoxB